MLVYSPLALIAHRWNQGKSHQQTVQPTSKFKEFSGVKTLAIAQANHHHTGNCLPNCR
jgi:hypothetical protein